MNKAFVKESDESEDADAGAEVAADLAPKRLHVHVGENGPEDVRVKEPGDGLLRQSNDSVQSSGVAANEGHLQKVVKGNENGQREDNADDSAQTESSQHSRALGSW